MRGVCASLPSRSHTVSAALKDSAVPVGSSEVWLGASPRSRELVSQGKRRVALREGLGGAPVPALSCPSFLSLLVPRARMAAAKAGW